MYYSILPASERRNAYEKQNLSVPAADRLSRAGVALEVLRHVNIVNSMSELWEATATRALRFCLDARCGHLCLSMAWEWRTYPRAW